MRAAQQLHFRSQLLGQNLGQFDQVQYVGGRVGELTRPQRPRRPVGALLVLGKLHIEVTLGEARQADGRVSEQLCADHRVEEIRELERAVALEHEDVVLGGVEDLADVRRGHDGPER